MLKAEPPGARQRSRWLKHGRRGLGLLLVLVVLLVPMSVGLASSRARVSPPDGLNLRSDASTSSAIVAVFPFGAMVDVLSGPTADGWYRVAAQGQQGFVSGTFLDFVPTPQLRGDAMVTPSDGVRLRSGPSTAAPIFTVLPAGTAVHIAGDVTGDGWYPVLVASSAGWVDGSYLEALAGDAQAAHITWYGHDFDGGVLACGGVFNADDPGVAATNGWPCGAHLKVCQGNRCVTVIVRDRGRLPTGSIDLSAAAFQRLAPLDAGVLSGTLQATADPPATAAFPPGPGTTGGSTGASGPSSPPLPQQ